MLTIIKAIADKFTRHAAPAPPDDLPGYVAHMLKRAADRGYTTLHASDFAADRDHSPAMRRIIDYIRTSYPKELEMVQQATGACIYYDWPQVILLPDPEGALATFCAQNPLPFNLGKLQADGMTDFDLYAEMAIHEATHAMGNDKQSLCTNEAHVFAIAAARSLNHGINEKLHELFTNLSLYGASYNLIFPLVEKDDYAWVPVTQSWIGTRRNDKKTWDRAQDRFHPAAYKAFDATGRAGRVYHERPCPGEARTALDRYLDLSHYDRPKLSCEDRYKLRDAAFNAARDLIAAGRITKDGPDNNLRAALILRQMARGLDGALQYTDSYVAPPSARKQPAAPATVA